MRRMAFASWVLASALVVLVGFASQSTAEVIGTAEAMAAEAREARVAEVQALMSRDDVAQAMVRLGVDPDDARQRVAVLSDAELEQLQHDLETAPAGGQLLAALGIVLIVLVILELTGAIDIFKRG